MEELKVRVDYYNKKHKKKFIANPDYKLFDAVAEKLVDIKISEFNTYFIFTEQHDRDGFRRFSELKERFETRIGLLEHLDFSGDTIKAKTPYQSVPKDIRERVGVSVSLCLANKIYNLTEADWEGVPETNKNKTLDYNICSNGNKYIYVESKGSAVEDNKKKSSTISQHKGSIESKKSSSPTKSTNIYFGVITAIDNGTNLYTQSWLLDPDAPTIQINPGKFRLLSRLYYYWRNLADIFGFRSTILIALINRINIISTLQDYSLVDKLPLYRSDGKEIVFNFRSYTSKSQLFIEKVVGNVYPVGPKKILFVGFIEEVFNLLISQNFNEIVQYKSNQRSIQSVLSCRIGLNELKHFKELNESFERYKVKDKQYIEVELSGVFNFTTSGRVYSILDLDQLEEGKASSKE